MTTAIEWTDETWNPVVGCTKASGGCDHCYAKTLHGMRHKAALAGKAVHPQYLQPFETVQLMPERLEAPLHWRKPRRCFVNSVSDLFHEDVPDEFLDRVFAVMTRAHWHTFQVLTKRAERMQAYMSAPGRVERVNRVVAEMEGRVFLGPPFMAWPRQNVWLGVSVENQACAKYRIPLLLQTPAAMRFLSCEPLLGPVDLSLWLEEEGFIDESYVPPVDWVIVGGESGAGARPCDIGWVEAIVAGCDLNGIACFVKQLGAVPMQSEAVWRERLRITGMAWLLNARNNKRVPEGFVPLQVGHAKGGNPKGWPAELRVREFPAPRVPV